METKKKMSSILEDTRKFIQEFETQVINTYKTIRDGLPVSLTISALELETKSVDLKKCYARFTITNHHSSLRRLVVKIDLDYVVMIGFQTRVVNLLPYDEVPEKLHGLAIFFEEELHFIDKVSKYIREGVKF